MTTPAEELFDVIYKHQFNITKMDGVISDIVGFIPDDITYDPYDSSFELKEVYDITWKPTKDMIIKLRKLGFDRFWVCYVDGSERSFRDTDVCTHKVTKTSGYTIEELEN